VRIHRDCRPSGELGPNLIGNCKIHDHNRATENQMEMGRHPRCVVEHRVKAVAHVDEAAATAKEKHHKRKPRREHHGTVPGQCRNPAEESAAAAQTASDLHRSRDGEDGQQRRDSNEEGEEHLNEFESG
jgi:hypothetical protein